MGSYEAFASTSLEVPEQSIISIVPDEFEAMMRALESLNASLYGYSRYVTYDDIDYMIDDIEEERLEGIEQSLPNYLSRIDLAYNRMTAAVKEKTGVVVWLEHVYGDSQLEQLIPDGYFFCTHMELDKKLVKLETKIHTYVSEG